MHAKDATTKTSDSTCLCGCGGTTRGTFKPGNDARTVSQLVAVVKADNVTKSGIAKLAKALPSEALRAKFTRAAERALSTRPTKTEDAA